MNDRGFDQPSPIIINTTESVPKHQNSIGNLLTEWQKAQNIDENYTLDFLSSESHNSNKNANHFRLRLSGLFDSKSYFNYGELSFLKNAPDMEFLNQLSTDSNFPKKSELANYISKTILFKTNTTDPEDQSAIKRLKEYKNKLFSPLKNITVNLLHDHNSDAVKKIMNYILSSNSSEFSQTVLSDPSLNTQELLDFSIEHINTFGIINGIDLISQNIDKNPNLKSVYETIQGKNITKIYKDLQEVYSGIDFGKYFLNTEELTQKEIKIIKEEIEKHSQKNKTNSKSIQVLDIGAGTGRHIIPLFKDGYQTTAIEIQPEHIIQIQNKEPNLPIEQQNWLNLELKQHADFAYCLERAALHNRTPQDMLSFFDNISTNLNKNGTLLIDFPNTSVGIYQSEVESYQENLIKLGIDSKKVQHIFDGPESEHEFNRMAPTQKQIETYAKLTGFKATLIKSTNENNITNNYYSFSKDENFDLSQINTSELMKDLQDLGITPETVDLNKKINLWNVKIGHIFVFGNKNLDNDNFHYHFSKDSKQRTYIHATGN